MKIFNKKEITKILFSETPQDLKNNLKIQDEDNYIEKLSKLYIDLINNFDEEYIPVIEIVLQEIENETSISNKNFIEMTKEIIIYRELLDKINKQIKENLNNEHNKYLYLKDDKERFEEIENKFDRIIKKSKIVKKTNNKKEEIKELLEYLNEQIEIVNDYNMDIINKILSSLEYLSNQENIIEQEELKKLKQHIKKKLKKNKQIKEELIYVTKKLEQIENNFNKITKKSKIIKNEQEETNELLSYLDKQIENINEYNIVTINKILRNLETMSGPENIIEQEKLKKIKSTIKKKLKKNKQIKEQLIYVSKKLEQIENNLLTPEDKLKKLETMNFDKLVEELDKLTDNFIITKADTAYKIIELLEKKVLKSNNKKESYDYNKLLKVKKKIIEHIKNTPKITRKKKEYIHLKEITNKIENLELNIIYEINSSETINNYNIVNYIIFNLKDIECANNLIENNPHLINAFSLKTKNIIKKVVEKYIEAVEELIKKGTYKNLCYYDKVLLNLLNSKVIYYNEKILEECKEKVKKHIKKINNEQANEWYKRLNEILINPDQITEKESLDKLFNMNCNCNEIIKDFNIIKKETPKNEEFIFTIDDEGAINRDDAISVSKKENDIHNLKIYIADPNYVFEKTSKVLKRAREKGETLYLIDKSIEMFDEKVIKECLSLDENKLRAVKVYDYLLSNKGEVIDFSISREQITVDKNYSYQDFSEIMKKSTSNQEEDFMEKLLLLERIIKNQISSNEKELVISGQNIENSELLVATFMIYNNYKVAEYFAKENLPFIYRHYSNESDINEDLLRITPIFEQTTINKIIDEIGMTPGHASYSVDKQSHEGLSIPYYSHITSPNRRYADIIASDCIDVLYFQKLNDSQIKVFEKYLKREVEHLNDRLIANASYQEEYSKHVLQRK